MAARVGPKVTVIKTREPSPLERHAAHMMHIAGVPKPEPWYRFMRDEGRAFEFDFAWPEQMVAFEVEGLATKRNPKSRHQTWSGYSRDCEKYNLAAIRGWRVIRATQSQIETCQFLDWLEPLLGPFRKQKSREGADGVA